MNSTPVDIDDHFDAWLLDGHGGGRELDWDEAAACHPGGHEWLWLHLDYTSGQIQDWMYEGSNLPELVIESLLQPETRPRCTPADNGLMVFLRGVNLKPGSDPEDLVSIRLWADEKRVITLRKRHLLSVDDIRQFIEQGSGPASPGDFLVMLVDRLLDRVGAVIDDLYDQVDGLEDSILAEANQYQRENLAEIRRQAIALRRFLAPQREALNRLTTEKTSLLDDKQRMLLREEYDRLTRMVEDLDAARERAAVAHESLISRHAEQTNQRMYLLSIIAAIFLPLSFMTGLLGINVGGIPGADNALAFPAVVLLMVAIGAGLWIYLRWHRWF